MEIENQERILSFFVNRVFPIETNTVSISQLTILFVESSIFTFFLEIPD
jgi:hypothetical protein